jgi:hypothetical protein
VKRIEIYLEIASVSKMAILKLFLPFSLFLCQQHSQASILDLEVIK